jgi:hypothetical protein
MLTTFAALAPVFLLIARGRLLRARLLYHILSRRSRS